VTHSPWTKAAHPYEVAACQFDTRQSRSLSHSISSEKIVEAPGFGWSLVGSNF
jgi:hypothetical protein